MRMFPACVMSCSRPANMSLIFSSRWLQFWRSVPTCCVSPWRRCDSLTTLRPSSDAPSSSTTSFGGYELRSYSRAPTGASHPTRRLRPAPASCHPQPTLHTRPSTEPCPPGSAYRPKPDRPSGSASEWSVQDRGSCSPTVLRHAAASTRRRRPQDTTSTSLSLCMTPHSPPARPHHTLPPSSS